jgi:hypothetical protein
MFRQTLSLLAVAVLCMGAAQSAKPAPARPPASKAATVKPAAKAAPRPSPKGAASRPSGAFDARDPSAFIALLATLDAKGQVARREADAIFMTVTSPTEVFSIQFAGCGPQGRGCQALLFDRLATEGAPTPAQINGFNQTSMMCRGYQDKAGKAHVEYSALLFPRNTRDEMLMHLNAWRGCIADFREFSKDPAAFLASAP